MNDGLVAVLTELTYAQLSWNEIAKRMHEEVFPDQQNYNGQAAKHGLRIILERLAERSKDVKLITLPATDYSTCKDTGKQILVQGKSGSRIIHVDSALIVNGRPATVDIRISRWTNLTNKYFRDGETDRRIVLDDMFGASAYDCVLVVPDAERKVYHGVHIVKPSFSRAGFGQAAEETARKYGFTFSQTSHP